MKFLQSTEKTYLARPRIGAPVPKSFKLKAKSSRGFTLLLSVLIASLLLAIGLAIFNIILKEVLLSSIGRESQFAVYAADSGTECALYWDVVQRSFATSSASTPPASGVLCNGVDIAAAGNPDGAGGPWSVTNLTPTGAQTRFRFAFPPEPYCTIVTVTKTANPTRTTVESRGYNTCDTGNPRRVERAFRVRY